ncbi:MAG: hypothetical protein C0594_09355 [Marinilabiliales bacterium]|nr:MAG: hypothetical protein C0594_09355 [Marinilabiliales bacterium]
MLKGDQNKKPTIDEFISQSSVPFNKSKEEIWTQLESKLNNSNKKRILPVKRQFVLYAAAAIIVIILGSTFLRFFSKSILCEKGEHVSYMLPDGSNVYLNADSRISYKPFWWFVSRELELEGEAYFEVTKGKEFIVHSDLGSTEVLGTSFDIYTRNKSYNVLCKTGKVKVKVHPNGEENILTSGLYLSFNAEDQASLVEEIIPHRILSWTNGIFNFEAMKLSRVFDEIERQYDIVINVEDQSVLNEKYSGSFKRTEDVDFILDIICQPLNLNYVWKNNDVIVISKK